jgi:hypothetical protein
MAWLNVEFGTEQKCREQKPLINCDKLYTENIKRLNLHAAHASYCIL